MGGFRRADVVAHNRRREPVGGRVLLGEIDERLVVAVVITGPSSSDTDGYSAVAIGVERRDDLIGLGFFSWFFSRLLCWFFSRLLCWFFCWFFSRLLCRGLGGCRLRFSLPIAAACGRHHRER